MKSLRLTTEELDLLSLCMAAVYVKTVPQLVTVDPDWSVLVLHSKEIANLWVKVINTK
jgi:hypothetical protein